MARFFSESVRVEFSGEWRSEFARVASLIEEAKAIYRELCEASAALSDAGDPFDLRGCEAERGRWLAAVAAYKRTRPED